MDEVDDLSQQLKALFAGIYRSSHKPAIVRFKRKRDGGRLIGIEFTHAAKWPAAPFAEMNAALLALHHAGFIKYSANTITLTDKLLQSDVHRNAEN